MSVIIHFLEQLEVKKALLLPPELSATVTPVLIYKNFPASPKS